MSPMARQLAHYLVCHWGHEMAFCLAQQMGIYSLLMKDLLSLLNLVVMMVHTMVLVMDCYLDFEMASKLAHLKVYR